MAKNPKLHVKNTQLAGAINLRGLKAKLSRKKEPELVEEELKKVSESQNDSASEQPEVVKVVSQEKVEEVLPKTEVVAEISVPEEVPVQKKKAAPTVLKEKKKKPEKLGPVFVKKGEDLLCKNVEEIAPEKPKPKKKEAKVIPPKVEEVAVKVEKEVPVATVSQVKKEVLKKEPVFLSTIKDNPDKLGPVFNKKPPVSDKKKVGAEKSTSTGTKKEGVASSTPSTDVRWNWADSKSKKPDSLSDSAKKAKQGAFGNRGASNARLRQGVGIDEEDEFGRRRRRKTGRARIEAVQEIIRPTQITVRIPICVKDLAAEMKLKASQLVSTLFMQGVIVTLNDVLDDETLVQLLGQELGCEILIDTKEEERLRITGETVAEEIAKENPEELISRPPVVAFMGHVDHGKTSLIDRIRKSDIAQGEVGAITQHIGAFTCHVDQGLISIIDTPGHEAFTAMRERGAGITDIVILVVAGDEGMRDQTHEALNQARTAGATIIVAINKSDKSAFDQDKVFRQMADNNLLPEAWGGQTIAVPCSATTGDGIPELLEMISLQAEILELRANPKRRARGVVIEAQMEKGLGAVATILVQNGTLRVGDALVFDTAYARVKAMRNELGKEIDVAAPSTPVRVNGLSGLPSSGDDFIVVESEKEARDIADKRKEGQRQLAFQTKRRRSLENMMEQQGVEMKVVPLILRADVQGSLDALKTSLSKIVSDKVLLNIISMGIGEISESDVQLAATSKAAILGFHTGIEAHAEPMIKMFGVDVHMHDIIYHAQDDIQALMKSKLDKLAQEKETGKIEVRALFKSSQIGTIAGCMVLDGTILRNHRMRVRRGDEVLWTGGIDSLKRFKDDVKEVSKGMECGIVLQGFSDFAEGDLLEAFEVTYIEQEL